MPLTKYYLKIDSVTNKRLRVDSTSTFELLLHQAVDIPFWPVEPVDRKTGKTVYAALHKKLEVDTPYVRTN